MRRILALLLVLTASARAQPVIHASAARELTEHKRTVHDELARSLAGTNAQLDVSLAKVSETLIGTDIEVRAEVLAMVSNTRGEIRWTSRARATVRGALRNRAQLRRDAVIEATRALATTIRKRL